MKDGDPVVFRITGNVGAYKGVVVKADGHYGRPEIRVTHTRNGKEEWIPVEHGRPWPVLKDGDYILMTAAERG